MIVNSFQNNFGETKMKHKVFTFDIISLLFYISLILEGHTAEFLCLVLAVVLHESGHLAVAHLLHIRIRSVHFSVLGAKIDVDDAYLPYRKEFLLCAAGPFSSLMGALVARVCFGESRVMLFALLSFALGLVNLMPAGALDGGRMFRILCLQVLKPHKALRVFRFTSFFSILFLWLISLYLLLRCGDCISLFAFSLVLFMRFFLSTKSE